MAEPVVLGLNADFIKSRGPSAVGVAGLLLMNNYRGLHGPWPNLWPHAVPQHKVLLSSTLCRSTCWAECLLGSAVSSQPCDSALLTWIFENGVRWSEIFGPSAAVIISCQIYEEDLWRGLWKSTQKYNGIGQKLLSACVIPKCVWSQYSVWVD